MIENVNDDVFMNANDYILCRQDFLSAKHVFTVLLKYLGKK